MRLNVICRQTAQLRLHISRPQSVFAILYPASLNQHAQSKAASPYQEQQTTVSLVSRTFLLKIFFHLKAKKYLA